MFTCYVESQTIKYCVCSVYIIVGFYATFILLYIYISSDILSSFEKVIIMILIVLEYTHTLFIYMVVEVYIVKEEW